jgi:hypothetical protein
MYILHFDTAIWFVLAQIAGLITIIQLWRRLRWAERWMRWYAEHSEYLLPPRDETPQQIRRQAQRKARAR